jgi:hypothetical protein
MRGEESHSFEGIRTLKEVNVTVENMRVPDESTWRKSDSDSGVEDDLQRKQASKMGSEDELPLAREVPKKVVEWKN